jgi:hypothetical protein
LYREFGGHRLLTRSHFNHSVNTLGRTYSAEHSFGDDFRMADDSSGSSTLPVRRPLSFSWRALIVLCATITLASGTHPVRGKGRSPPDLQSILANLLSAQYADNGHSMKGGRCDRFHRRAPITSRATQSPTSEGPSQEPAESGRCEIVDRGAVPDRASLWIC